MVAGRGAQMALRVPERINAASGSPRSRRMLRVVFTGTISGIASREVHGEPDIPSATSMTFSAPVGLPTAAHRRRQTNRVTSFRSRTRASKAWDSR